MNEKIRLLYDVERRRPACVLLQAAAGGDTYALNALFSSESWLDCPTPGMRMISGTREEWERAAKLQPTGCFRSGWPKCCGQTMSIEPPEEHDPRRTYSGGGA